MQPITKKKQLKAYSYKVLRDIHGGENILVWQHMMAQRGKNRGSVLVGSSMHNQRLNVYGEMSFHALGMFFTILSNQWKHLVCLTLRTHCICLCFITFTSQELMLLLIVLWRPGTGIRLELKETGLQNKFSPME